MWRWQQGCVSCLLPLPLKTQWCGLSQAHLANCDSIRLAVKGWPAPSCRLETFASRSNGSSGRRLCLISALFISSLINWTLTGADWSPGSWNTKKKKKTEVMSRSRRSATCPCLSGTQVYHPCFSKVIKFLPFGSPFACRICILQNKTSGEEVKSGSVIGQEGTITI